jgi:hypothetical protein
VFDLLNSSGNVEVTGPSVATAFFPFYSSEISSQELSLQRVDCSPECLLQSLSILASMRLRTTPLSKLRCV